MQLMKMIEKGVSFVHRVRRLKVRIRRSGGTRGVRIYKHREGYVNE